MGLDIFRVGSALLDFLVYALKRHLFQRLMLDSALFGHLLPHLVWDCLLKVIASFLENLFDFFETVGRVLIWSGC